MEILWFDQLPSTQIFLVDKLKKASLQEELLVATKNQTAGIGSRGNQWEGMEGNLFFSFAFAKSRLPSDLPINATSIYFSMLLKSILERKGSKVWIKWPNDFYIDESKVGGTITTIVSDFLICGIGLNLLKRQDNFKSFDIEIDTEGILKEFVILLKNAPPWKKVLKKFEIEFELSKKFHTHYNDNKLALTNATLCDDGSLMIDKQRIYSLR